MCDSPQGSEIAWFVSRHPGLLQVIVRIPILSFWLLLFLAPAAWGETLVICPPLFREALVPWESFRRAQGHAIEVVDPPGSAARVKATVRKAAKARDLKFLVIIGDVPGGGAAEGATVPTNYVGAKVNTRWGSEAMIASDVPFGDLDGDQVPEIAVGRIPADTPEELSAVVRKIIRYETASQLGDWQRRLEVVGGIGGFGLIADSLIEGVAQQVFLQTVPPDYQIGQTMANPKSPHYPPPGRFGSHVRDRINAGCLAWVYLGHGLSTELDRVRTPAGDESIMTVADVGELRCGSCSPLAVMIACYTGAFDATNDCLAERLLIEEEGPVAVIAATRITMPYGNTVLGCELLRACFRDRPAAIGDTLRIAQARTAAKPLPEDALRLSFDTLAAALSPAPVDLEAERLEHISMYQLLGDPLIRLQRPGDTVIGSRPARLVK